MDGQTDTHAVATSVLQSQQASGIPYAIHLKNKIDSTSIKTNLLLYRERLSSDTFTAFYLLEVRQTMETTEVRQAMETTEVRQAMETTEVRQAMETTEVRQTMETTEVRQTM